MTANSEIDMAYLGRDGDAKRIQCMENDCPLTVDEKTIEMLVDKLASQRYVHQHQILSTPNV